MKTKLQIWTSMLKYLVLATFILAAAAYHLWYSRPAFPLDDRIYIHKAPPRATVVLQMENGNEQR